MPAQNTTEEERRHLAESLSRPLPEIPPRYFYDDLGSALFEQITAVPEYYQTRTELAILEANAGEILALSTPEHLVELGSGAGRKIRLLLERLQGGTCTMLDVNRTFLDDSIQTLSRDFPQISFRGVVGDLNRDLGRLGPGGRRLTLFFAGTIGNLNADERHHLLVSLAETMAPSDALLVGVDLVKDRARLEAAYNDAEGVTAAFNLNALNVLNRAFDADFQVGQFEHVAFYDPARAWIEMRVRARRAQRVRVGALGLTLDLPAGGEIRTEISCKFTKASLTRAAAAAGLGLRRWFTDPDGLFALALLVPAAAEAA